MYILTITLTVCIGYFLSLNLAIAEVYKTIGPNGEIIYSDVPEKENSQPYETPDINIIPALPSRLSRTDTKKTHKKSAFHYRLFKITKPDNEASIATYQSVVVNVTVKPRLNLQRGHQIQFSVDNKILKTGTATSYTIQTLNRGSHTISAAIIDPVSKKILQSDSITLFARHPSDNNSSMRQGPRALQAPKAPQAPRAN